MEENRIIEYLRDFFNGLDHDRQRERYPETDYCKYMKAEDALRALVLTDNDCKVLSRLSAYDNPRDYLNADELIPLCDTTTAKERIHDWITTRYHMEEARIGDI